MAAAAVAATSTSSRSVLSRVVRQVKEVLERVRTGLAGARLVVSLDPVVPRDEVDITLPYLSITATRADGDTPRMRSPGHKSVRLKLGLHCQVAQVNRV